MTWAMRKEGFLSIVVTAVLRLHGWIRRYYVNSLHNMSIAKSISLSLDFIRDGRGQSETSKTKNEATQDIQDPPTATGDQTTRRAPPQRELRRKLTRLKGRAQPRLKEQSSRCISAACPVAPRCASDPTPASVSSWIFFLARRPPASCTDRQPLTIATPTFLSNIRATPRSFTTSSACPRTRMPARSRRRTARRPSRTTPTREATRRR